jgi:hypothetical protein
MRVPFLFTSFHFIGPKGLKIKEASALAGASFFVVFARCILSRIPS